MAKLTKSAASKGGGAVVLAALVAAVIRLGLVQDAPKVDYNPAVTSPATRGFGPATVNNCPTEDFVLVSIFGRVRLWNQGALMPLRAAMEQAIETSEYRPDFSVGTYSCRLVRGSTSTMSHHSWSTAVDMDPPQNCLGCPISQSEIAKDLAFVRSFEKFGFVWGGRWTSRPDAMHFEYDGPALPVHGPVKPGDRGPLVHKVRAFCEANGLAHETRGTYRGDDLLCVIAFQVRNKLLNIETPGTVGDPTWVLMLLAGR